MNKSLSSDAQSSAAAQLRLCLAFRVQQSRSRFPRFHGINILFELSSHLLWRRRRSTACLQDVEVIITAAVAADESLIIIIIFIKSNVSSDDHPLIDRMIWRVNIKINQRDLHIFLNHRSGLLSNTFFSCLPFPGLYNMGRSFIKRSID